jgi:hypothetical protein
VSARVSLAVERRRLVPRPNTSRSLKVETALTSSSQVILRLRLRMPPVSSPSAANITGSNQRTKTNSDLVRTCAFVRKVPATGSNARLETENEPLK